MRFFTNVETIEELKKEFRKQAFIHHPDKGGDVDTMKLLNKEYEIMFSKLQKTSTNKADHTVLMDDFREIIEKIIMLDIEIEICGSWIWVSGDTKPVKKQLKESGLFWASKKEMWYWRPEDKKHTGKSKMSMDDIRGKYGSEKIQTKKGFVLA